MRNLKLLFSVLLVLLGVSQIKAQNCEAEFFSVVDTMNLVHFIDQSEAYGDYICTYNWDFDDGHSSLESNPSHLYDSAGQYEVCLIIQTSSDPECNVIECADTICYFVSVQDFMPCDLDISATISPASSSVSFDGSIDLTVNGGFAPYFFFWNTGHTSEDISGIPAGEYSVLVSDFTGCVDTLSFWVGIEQPCNLNIDYYVVNPSHTGADDGSINLTVSGGIEPYEFLWSNGATTEDISDLTEGEYSVIVLDLFACVDSLTIILEDSLDCDLSLSYTSIPVSEFAASDGSIDLTVAGGTQPYSYLWSNGETTEDIDQLGAGTYTVVVEDANQCEESLTVNLVNPPEEVYSLSGQVYAKTNLLPEGIALLINNDHQAIAKVDIVSGQFEFLDLDSGSYTVYAVPYFDLNYEVFPIYFPTYAGEQNQWLQSEMLLVDSIRTTSIQLDYYDEINHGPAYLEGQVKYENESLDHIEIFQQNWFSSFRSTTAVYASNISVFLIDHNHELIDFCLTDVNGKYSFNKIPFGTYSIHAEQTGRQMNMLSVNLNEEQDSLIDVNLNILEDQIINVPEVSFEDFDMEISPNPFSEFINVKLKNYKSYNLEIFICDLLGRKLLKTTFLDDEAHFKTQVLERGVYVMFIKSGDNVVFQEKIIKR